MSENNQIKVYGIDLGTTYSAIATLDESGRPEILKNIHDQSDFLASVIYFEAGKDEPIVGNAAKRPLNMDKTRGADFVKLEIGKRLLVKQMQTESKEDHDKRVKSPIRNIDGKDYDPITLSSLILKRLVQIAAEQGHEVKNVAITVPAFFGNNERNATRQAAKLAGLNVLKIINEPTAAAMHYLSEEWGKFERMLVYDLGGGTFDVTLIEISIDGETKKVDILDSIGDDALGGKNWDEILFTYMQELYAKKLSPNEELDISILNDVKEDSKVTRDINERLEATKKDLSTTDTTQYIGDYSIFVEKSEFEKLTSSLVTRTMDLVNSICNSHSDKPIDLVLLVGGSTRMPMIKAAIETKFPEKWRFAEDVDLVVAKGAAIAAGNEVIDILEKYLESMKNRPEGLSLADQEILTHQKEKVINIYGSDQNIPTVEQHIQSNPIQGNLTGPIKTKDQLSKSFGAEILGPPPHEYTYIDNIHHNGDEPDIRSKSYYTPFDDMTRLKIMIYEHTRKKGEEEIRIKENIDHNDGSHTPADNSNVIKNDLGYIVVDLPHSPPKGYQIDVYIKANESGIEYAFAQDPKTDKIYPVNIESGFLLSDEEFQKQKHLIDQLRTRAR